MAIGAEHTENIVDNDRKFLIDPLTRVIKNPSCNKELVQYDSLSEAFTFEMPRYVEGHDMGNAKNIKVYYANKGSEQEVVDSSDITSNRIVNDENIYLKWVIPANATQYEGTLDFAITFSCPEVAPDYIWSTKIYSGITINKGLRNSSEIIKRDPDAFDAILTRVSEVETKAEESENKVDGMDERVTTLENKMNSDDGTEVVFYYSSVYVPGSGATTVKKVIIDGAEYEKAAYDTSYPSNLTFETLSEKVVDAINNGRVMFFDGKYISLNDYVINRDSESNVMSIKLRNNADNTFNSQNTLSEIKYYSVDIDESSLSIDSGTKTVYDNEYGNQHLIFDLGDDGVVNSIIVPKNSGQSESYDTTSNLPSTILSYGNIVNTIKTFFRSSNPILARTNNNDNTYTYYSLNSYSCVGGNGSINSDNIMPYSAKIICLTFTGFNYKDEAVSNYNYCVLINLNTNKITYSTANT